MKLFKKLAAVALAAVLALSMVGCGKANSVNATKQFILDLMNDAATMAGGEYHNTAELDSVAQKLLTEANVAYNDETQTDKAVSTLLQIAAGKEGVLKEGTACDILYTVDHQYKTSFIPDDEKQEGIMANLYMNAILVNGGVSQSATKIDIGIAVGKIGDKSYVVVVQTETPAAE